MLKIELPEYDAESFLPFGASDSDVEEWIISEDKMFQDFPERLIHKDESGTEWVSLYFYQENKLQPPNEEISVIGFPIGEQQSGRVLQCILLLMKWKSYRRRTDRFRIYSKPIFLYKRLLFFI